MTNEAPKRSWFSLFLVILLFAAPTFGALFLVMNPEYLPSKTKNYGTLIEQVALPSEPLEQLDGTMLDTSQTAGRWALLTFLGDNCDAACEKTLYHVRQIRKAMANNRKNIDRIAILVDDKVAKTLTPEILNAHKGLYILKTSPAVDTFIQALKETPASIKQKIFLVDPRGMAMMSYSADQDPVNVIKDFELLLKAFPVE